MKTHAAFLRGVSPMNCRMPELARAFEAAGFTGVRTLLSSGNVVFGAADTERAIRRKAEAAMEQRLGNAFYTLVRTIDHLQGMLDADPFAAFALPAGAKRVVTFLDTVPVARLDLPLEVDGARIVALRGREVFTTYVPSPKGAAFMVLLERTFGKDATTRSWDTVRKVCAAAAAG